MNLITKLLNELSKAKETKTSLEQIEKEDKVNLQSQIFQINNFISSLESKIKLLSNPEKLSIVQAQNKFRELIKNARREGRTIDAIRLEIKKLSHEIKETKRAYYKEAHITERKEFQSKKAKLSNICTHKHIQLKNEKEKHKAKVFSKSSDTLTKG